MHEHDKTGLVRCVFPCLLMQLITPTDARLVWEKATQGTHSPPSIISFLPPFLLSDTNGICTQLAQEDTAS